MLEIYLVIVALIAIAAFLREAWLFNRLSVQFVDVENERAELLGENDELAIQLCGALEREDALRAENLDLCADNAESERVTRLQARVILELEYERLVPNRSNRSSTKPLAILMLANPRG